MDDLLSISLDARSIILEVAEESKYKKENIEPPQVYPEGSIAKKSLNVQYL